jgi:tetratricopeptide (TPR) repeat protein
VSYYSLQSFDTARFYLEAALLQNLAKPDARTLAFLGVIYRDQKQFDKAQVMFENALKLQKSDEIADLIIQQGLTYKLAGQKDSAFAKYMLAQQVDPNDTDALYEMGTLLETDPKQRLAATRCFVGYLERTPTRTSKAAQYALQRLESWGYNTQSLATPTPTTATLNVMFSAPQTTSTVQPTQTLHTTTGSFGVTDATLRLLPETPAQSATAGTMRKER